MGDSMLILNQVLQTLDPVFLQGDIFSSIKHLLSAYFMIGTMTETRDRKMNKICFLPSKSSYPNNE